MFKRRDWRHLHGADGGDTSSSSDDEGLTASEESSGHAAGGKSDDDSDDDGDNAVSSSPSRSSASESEEKSGSSDNDDEGALGRRRRKIGFGFTRRRKERGTTAFNVCFSPPRPQKPFLLLQTKTLTEDLDDGADDLLASGRRLEDLSEDDFEDRGSSDDSGSLLW